MIRFRSPRSAFVVAAGLALSGAIVTMFYGPGLLKGGTGAFRQEAHFQKHVRPVLNKHCLECHNDAKHKAGFSLEAYTNLMVLHDNRELWVELLRKVRSQEMPPVDKPQPTEKERERIVAWVEAELFPVDFDNPDPGRVTIRRLNRAEFNNTVRDLLGVEFHPADDFPEDDTGYGFDNIGDVLSLSPLLLEKYLAAAEGIMESVLTNRAAKARLFIASPESRNTNACLEQIISSFARRAFRRPTTVEETSRLVDFAKNLLARGESFEGSVKLACEAVLVSPHFLFRGELQPDPNNPARTHLIDEFSLASRLSYFLWSSMPDEELFTLSGKGRLRRELPKQVQRMLKDPKAGALVANFAGQWLQLRNVQSVTPDPALFPRFNEELRAAMVRETELFFEHMVRDDRNVMEFLTADYTFVNEPLARHYGFKQNIAGNEFQRVSLKGSGRAGVLTHASVLALTSNPTRTSPVKRGKWVLETLLAQRPPPPPPDVPPLAESKEAVASASLRERFEQHRADPLCASCHAQMDPIGFSLENFDAIGAWRDKDGAFAVDVSGKLPGGKEFSGATGLKHVLVSERKEQFLRCLAEKMLTYALGRGIEYYDRPALEKIVAQVKKQDCRFSALVQAVVKSVPFQMRRGDGDRLARTDAAGG